MRKVTLLLALVFCFLAFNQAIAAQKVSIATLNWEPYVGENLTDKGFTSEIVSRAFEEAGYSPEINFMPWARVMKMTEKGRYDAAFPAYYSQERAQKYAISEAFAQGPVVLASKSGAGITYSSIDDLKPYRIGVVKGFVNSEEFDAADYLTKDPARNNLQNLKKLLKGRVDLIAIDKVVAVNLLKNNPSLSGDLGDVTFLDKPLDKKSLHVLISKNVDNYKQMLNDFNAALKSLSEDGTIDQILKKHGLK